jgi:hypothetical protein
MDLLGFCFYFFHEYEPWKDAETGRLKEGGRVIGLFTVQERRCKVCNKLESRTVKTIVVPD